MALPSEMKSCFKQGTSHQHQNQSLDLSIRSVPLWFILPAYIPALLTQGIGN
jgi:hypothetical protein